ncbi:MAG TPA: DivIVA domain-containing protein [Solirubrobacteraceae bacterium]|jgi:cell division septum initiation protein DivIVA
MPDQSTAATEHSLIQEITAPLATLPDDPVPDVANVSFPHALRGYDRLAVDAYVRKTSQLVAELQSTRSPEAAVRRALARVGEEVSGILQRAHDTAEQITAQSRVEAEERLEAARKEAAEITSGADRRLADLDSETDRIWSERHRIVEDTRELARQLVALAESAAERFPADAEESSAQEEATEQETEAEAGAGPEESLDRWEGEELDSWDETGGHEDETQLIEELGEHDGEATAAMPPVSAEEPPPEPPERPFDQTEETRKLD